MKEAHGPSEAKEQGMRLWVRLKSLYIKAIHKVFSPFIRPSQICNVWFEL